MTTQNNGIQIFEDKRIRTAWNEEREEWYFSIVDVVAVLKNCHQLKMVTADGKNRLVDVVFCNFSEVFCVYCY